MKLSDILIKAGSTILKTLIPGSGLLIDSVNAFLPKDKKLPNDATGIQVADAVNTLPPDQRVLVLMKEYDVEIVEINSWTQVQSSLAEADKSGASTRPKIALMMAKIVSFVVVAYSSALIIAIILDRVSMITSLSNTWPLMLAIIATPTLLLRAYFGMRSKEKENRYNVATGQSIQPGFLKGLLSTFGRKTS